MQKYFFTYTENIAKKYKELVMEPVLDIGASGGHNTKEIFSDLKWIGIDLREEEGITIMDAHNLKFDDESIGLVVSLTTFEHLDDPILASSEVYRVLKKGGLFILVVPYLHVKEHGRHKGYGDYWRFTPLCIKEVFLREYEILDFEVTKKLKFVLACGRK